MKEEMKRKHNRIKTKANIPLVGCRANEIENLFTAEPRVASEKERNRVLNMYNI